MRTYVELVVVNGFEFDTYVCLCHQMYRIYVNFKQTH